MCSIRLRFILKFSTYLFESSKRRRFRQLFFEFTKNIYNYLYGDKSVEEVLSVLAKKKILVEQNH